ncbi:MAG: helix-turn-helix domain-containing protein [Candidatus Caldarchaeum sp.]
MESPENRVVKILQESFNFNHYMAKAYVAVVSGYSKPMEIARRTRIPQTRVYDVLATLCQMGFIQKTTRGYFASNPSLAFANWLMAERERIEGEFAAKTKNLESLLALVRKFKKESGHESDTAIIRGLSPLVVKLLEMVEHADEFVFAVRKAAKLKETFKELVSRFAGKNYVFILHPSVEPDEHDKMFFAKMHAKVFVNSTVLLDILVTDKGEALIGLPFDDEPVAVWIKDEGFCESISTSLISLVEV